MTTMKSILLYAALLASSVSAQLLRHGNGYLPTCAHTCSNLITAQRNCHGGHTLKLSAWACFCPAVYAASDSNTANICPGLCSGSDALAVQSWFEANCGDDNGQSEHAQGGSSTPSTTTAVNGAASGSAAANNHLASSTASGVPADTDDGSGNCSGTWWSCHYQWIIMIIVIAIGLVALGFGGRWLKNRHDRRRDQIRSGFNAGVTSRPDNITDDKALGAGGSAFDANRDSPARTRDAFMPYGYGYSRSGHDVSQSEFSRGASPVDEMEKGDNPYEQSSRGGTRDKIRRAMVRDSR